MTEMTAVLPRFLTGTNSASKPKTHCLHFAASGIYNRWQMAACFTRRAVQVLLTGQTEIHLDARPQNH